MYRSCFRVLPFVQRFRFVESFVALESNQVRVGAGRDNFRELGLSHAGGAFDQKRFAEMRGQQDDRRDVVVANVLLIGQELSNVVDGGVRGFVAQSILSMFVFEDADRGRRRARNR